MRRLQRTSFTRGIEKEMQHSNVAAALLRVYTHSATTWPFSGVSCYCLIATTVRHFCVRDQGSLLRYGESVGHVVTQNMRLKMEIKI